MKEARPESGGNGRRRLPRRSAWATLLAAIVGAGALAGGADDSAFDPVVVLSPYEVTANRGEFAHWTKVTSPHFVIYTDARARDAFVLLKDMEMLHIVVQHFFGRMTMTHPRMIYILPTAHSDWRKLQSQGDVEWKVAVSGPRSDICDIGIVQSDWQERGPFLVWGTEGASVAEWLGLDLAFPIGFGLSTFFEAATFTDNRVRIGQQSVRTIYNQQNGWLPWGRFFAIDPKSPEFTRDTRELRQFTGQCATFVQFCLTNQDPVWISRLLVWNAFLTARHEADEEAFKAVFGQDWTGWQHTVEDYMKGGK